MDIDNLEELLEKADKDIKGVAPFVGEEAADLYHNNIKQMLYEGDFQPYYYNRREENGGYGDRGNIIVTPIQNGVVRIENITKGNENEPFADAVGQSIDEIIETGYGYTWNRQPPPRPIFEFTESELSNGLLETMYRIKLKDMGYELE